MKENSKIIIGIIIAVVLSTVINIGANTLLQADKVNFKTSNGDNVDVNSALDRLFSAIDINARLGSSDISSIGDGTITGAIKHLNDNGVDVSVSPITNFLYRVQITGISVENGYLYTLGWYSLEADSLTKKSYLLSDYLPSGWTVYNTVILDGNFSANVGYVAGNGAYASGRVSRSNGATNAYDDTVFGYANITSSYGTIGCLVMRTDFSVNLTQE